MSKQVRITADHAFVDGSLRSRGAIITVPNELREDWFEDAGLPAPEEAPEPKAEPMALSEFRRSQTPGTFIEQMKKVGKQHR